MDSIQILISDLDKFDDTALNVIIGLLDTADRAKLGDNSKTPIRILRMLANDESPWVKGCVAGNLNTPIDTLNMLAKDKNRDVKWKLKRNPNFL